MKYKLPSNKVSKAALVALATYQKGKDLKLAPKLTRAKLDPKHYAKMKVKRALQVFGHSVASALLFIANYLQANSEERSVMESTT